MLTNEQIDHRKIVAKGKLITLLDLAEKILANADVAAVGIDLRTDMHQRLKDAIGSVEILNRHMRNGL